VLLAPDRVSIGTRDSKLLDLTRVIFYYSDTRLFLFPVGNFISGCSFLNLQSFDEVLEFM